MVETLDPATLRILPANEASWADLQTVFGPRGEAARCQCQWFKLTPQEWRETPLAEREFRQRAETNCGTPGAESTTGLIAYLDGEPSGWVAVEPRRVYVHLRTMRVPWLGRHEDPEDDDVWTISCFVVRAGFRGRGLMYALTRAARDFARERGAAAVEGYPLITTPGQEFSWGELYVGARRAFEAAGFEEVSRPSARRAVMRIDFENDRTRD